MLYWRLVSAGVIVPTVLLLVWLDFHRIGMGIVGAWLLPLQLLIVGMGISEVLYLFRAGGFNPRLKLTIFVGLVVVAAFGSSVILQLLGLASAEHVKNIDFRLPMLALVLGIMTLFLGEITRFQKPGAGLVQTAMSVFAIAYVGGCFGFVSYLRLYHSNGWGMVALVSAIAIVKLSDTGAYFTGRLLGRHKMAPRLSPGKTWEGTAGGIVVACLFSCLFFRYIAPLIVESDMPVPYRPGAWLAYGLILAIAGIIGDLAESLMKREMHRKDSSGWLPGLGGVLDIIDSVLFAAPIAYFCWEWKLLGV